MKNFTLGNMSSMEEQLGQGYQQMMIGLIIFISGAIWGGMVATDGMVPEDIYWPASDDAVWSNDHLAWHNLWNWT